jgi:hypothetical protein
VPQHESGGLSLQIGQAAVSVCETIANGSGQIGADDFLEEMAMRQFLEEWRQGTSSRPLCAEASGEALS